MPYSEAYSMPSFPPCLLSLARELRRQRQRSAQIFYAVAVVGLLNISVVACSRVVLVNEASPIRIGNNIHGKVYTFDGTNWTLSDNDVSLPEGWYLVPPSFVAEDK
jgi:hypothetical protein